MPSTVEQVKRYRKKYPWTEHLRACRARCNNKRNIGYKNYGAKNIRCPLTIEIVKKLWFDCDAPAMMRPVLSRMNHRKNYEIGNVKFEEFSENAREACIRTFSKSVSQFTLEGVFVKTYPSMRAAQQATEIWYHSIGRNCRGEYATAGGFKWKYAVNAGK